MAATRSHLNPGFKVVFAGIGMVEDAIFFRAGCIAAPLQCGMPAAFVAPFP